MNCSKKRRPRRFEDAAVEPIQAALREQLNAATALWTVPDLVRGMQQRLRVSAPAVRQALNGMVASQELAYVDQFGHTFVQPNFQRPMRIGRIVLLPPQISYSAEPGDLPIRIQSGSAFGDGRHPTTRMALQLISEAREISTDEWAGVQALDIGTGSGVLAMAAVLCGAGAAIGLDIDPCARFEARENVRRNHLTAKICICNRSFRTLNGPFRLVCANLRTPTLMRCYPHVKGWVPPGGQVVMSGIKFEELDRILARYLSGFFLQRQVRALDWAAVLLQAPTGPQSAERQSFDEIRY